MADIYPHSSIKDPLWHYPYELLQGASDSSELIVVENKAFVKEKKIDENHHYVRCRFSNKSGCKVRGIIDTDQENFRYISR